MQKLTNQHLNEAYAYLAPEPEFNLFFIGDLEAFGMDGEEVACYTADSWKPGTILPYIILFYRGTNALIYSQNPDYDAEAAAAFLKERNPLNISGKDDLLKPMLSYLGEKKVRPTYLARLNKVTKEQKEAAGNVLDKVRRMTEADIPAIYDLYQYIEEFAYTYQGKEKEDSYEDIRQNIEKNGRTYGIFEGDRLVAAAQTSAENKTSAMVVGVATHPDWRRKGYARATVLKLCEDCLSENRDFLCLFYDNPAAGDIYHAIGFENLGIYTMLRKI